MKDFDSKYIQNLIKDILPSVVREELKSDYVQMIIAKYTEDTITKIVLKYRGVAFSVAGIITSLIIWNITMVVRNFDRMTYSIDQLNQARIGVEKSLSRIEGKLE